MVVQERQKGRSNWYTMFTTVHSFLRGDQWPITVHPSCDVCAWPLPPLSNPWVTDLLGNFCVTVLNMLKTSRQPWRPWRCLNILCTTLEWPRQPFSLLSAFNGNLASFVVAQGRLKGRSPCVKGVLDYIQEKCASYPNICNMPELARMPIVPHVLVSHCNIVVPSFGSCHHFLVWIIFSRTNLSKVEHCFFRIAAQYW